MSMSTLFVYIGRCQEENKNGNWQMIEMTDPCGDMSECCCVCACASITKRIENHIYLMDHMTYFNLY